MNDAMGNSSGNIDKRLEQLCENWDTSQMIAGLNHALFGLASGEDREFELGRGQADTVEFAGHHAFE